MKLLVTKEKILRTNTGKILHRKDSSTTYILKAGTYKWVDSPTLQALSTDTPLEFRSYERDFSRMRIASSFIFYFVELTRFTAYTSSGWSPSAYQTIVLSTDQQVSQEFYDWAITGGNLVKQHTLTFSGIGTVTVNGKTVTSGYLLEAGDVIVATPLLASGKPDKIGPNSVSVNGTWYDCPNTVSVNAGDVELILLAATADPNDGGGESLTINYTGFMPG